MMKLHRVRNTSIPSRIEPSVELMVESRMSRLSGIGPDVQVQARYVFSELNE